MAVLISIRYIIMNAGLLWIVGLVCHVNEIIIQVQTISFETCVHSLPSPNLHVVVGEQSTRPSSQFYAFECSCYFAFLPVVYYMPKINTALQFLGSSGGSCRILVRIGMY